MTDKESIILAQLQSVLRYLVEIHMGVKEGITGIYITGSIALGDYQHGKSDIDYVVVCNDPVALVGDVNEIQKRFRKKFAEILLNGSYIPVTSLAGQGAEMDSILYYENGKLKSTVYEMAPVTLLELKTTAITIYGLPAHQLPVQLDEKDVQEFLHQNINTYWKEWVNEHASWTKKKGLLVLFPRLTEWTLLGIARQLYTLKTGKIISKTGVGEYFREGLPRKYGWVIREALKARVKTGKHLVSFRGSYWVQPSLRRADATIECARYLFKLFEEEYNSYYK